MRCHRGAFSPSRSTCSSPGRARRTPPARTSGTARRLTPQTTGAMTPSGTATAISRKSCRRCPTAASPSRSRSRWMRRSGVQVSPTRPSRVRRQLGRVDGRSREGDDDHMVGAFIVVGCIVVFLVVLFWYGLRGEQNEDPALGSNMPYPEGFGPTGVGQPFLNTVIVGDAEE